MAKRAPKTKAPKKIKPPSAGARLEAALRSIDGRLERIEHDVRLAAERVDPGILKRIFGGGN